MKKIKPVILFLCSLVPLFLAAQQNIQKTLEWEDTPLIHTFANQETVEIWTFKGAAYDADYPSLPSLSTQFPVSSHGRLSVQIFDAEWETFNKLAADNDAALSNSIKFNTSVEQERKNFIGTINFIPIRKTSTGYERLVRFQLRVNFSAQPLGVVTRGGDNTFNSVLNDGDIFKIAVTETGIQKLTYNFLSTDLGMDLSSINPKNISIYGNGGGMLPERIDAERIDDLQENSIMIVGEEDGSFDSGDYILFYGESQDKWYFEPESKTFYMNKNIYDNQNYYFIKIGDSNGQRIENQPSVNSTAFTTEVFNDYQHYEEDLLNVMDASPFNQGSGKDWFGDLFKNINELTYDFQFENLVTSSPILVKSRLAGRSGSSTRFTVATGNKNLVSQNINSVTINNPTERTYAKTALSTGTFQATSDNIELTIKYPTNASGAIVSTSTEGWLDYIELNARRRLIMTGQQMAFRDTTALAYASTTYRLSNANSNIIVWDISNPLFPKNQAFTFSNNQISFGANTQNGLKEFIAFNKNEGIISATAIGKIENQNIHGTDNVDLVIVYHPEFEEQAFRLAEHRRTYSEMDVATIQVNKLFNEFSSGKQDPTAIRDFGKMVYERNPDKFKYMLLFGDGSFDYRNIKGGENSSFIPVYETNQSLDPIQAFPSDDFFCLISETEGTSNLTGKMDFSVGRLPVKTIDEARNVVDKIINYDSSPTTLGDWRNRLVFVADDEDNNLHMNQTDEIANSASNLYKEYNQDKIYLDAYPQVSTSGGEGYPTVTEALNRAMFKGMLAINYLGHGGSDGWTQERVLDKDRGDISGWTNYDKLPLFITATCSFSGYDDRNKVTAGEQVLLNEKGGGIALFTTTRAVFANSNKDLVMSVFDTMLYKIDGERPTLGDIFLIGKNTTSASTENSRKFNLLGDPSMQLAIPKYNVVTNQIDEHIVSDGLPDTLRALQKVTISGDIRDKNGQLLSDFNGTLFPTLFDKRVNYSTLGQDPKSYVQDFTLQKNIIFKGRASITNGKWTFTFVVPKDINYELGAGKISYYAHNGETDASGNYENILIGGTDPNALADDEGPKVEVFMNTEDFVFGGITDPNPTLLVKLEDDNGINVAGNSIGHDLEGILDENTQNTYLLNDFYEAALDDYTKGEVRYPLSELEDGLHAINVRAWDVANNTAQGYTEFVVTSSDKVALEHVLNYPNPFVNNTCFQFDHNMVNQEMDVLIQIFTVGGRLVKTLEKQIVSDGAIRQDDCIQWDGLDDYGDRLGRGVYLYKVKVRTLVGGEASFDGESDFEKLVILR